MATTGRQRASGPLPRMATVNSAPGRYVSTSTGWAYCSKRKRARSRSRAGVSHKLLANMPLPDPSATGFTNNGKRSATRSRSWGRSTSAKGAVETPGDVEHEIGVRARELFGETGTGIEADDTTEGTQSLLHRADGGGIVPLDVSVAATRRLVETRGVGLLVIRETYSHVVSDHLLQKGAAVVGGPGT